LSVGTPQFLFYGYDTNPGGLPAYDVTKDGNFIMVRTDANDRSADEIHVVLNWTQELLGRVPVN
jgi:hypothetical protein